MNNKKHIIILSGFVLCLMLGLYFQNRRENKLKESIETYGIVTYRNKYLTKGFGANVKYSVKGIEYDRGIRCDCRDLDIGDTILIKYSVEDPKTVALVGKYYMQKYKHKSSSER
jgi:hypothetical protein